MSVAADAAAVLAEGWFERKRWEPFPYQRAAWQAYRNGESGLVHAPTGTGKTYAVWLGPLEELAGFDPAGLRVLWITPLRALTQDTAQALRRPVDDLGLDCAIEVRTGDTPASVRRRQQTRLPACLITTPESLSILLTYPDARRRMGGLRCVIVDEWHELLGSKRGVQTELGLARLRGWCPGLRVWGLSATLGNLDQALDALVPGGRLISADVPRTTRIETVIPETMERFPWSGHLGLALLPQVVDALRSARSTLLFTNTRSQCELWHQAVAEACPDWRDRLALHHGSIDRALRETVEQGLREGRWRCVVCTSSLDLGVDFSPVDQVIQVGSPKGVARLMQRAGRSGHQPGGVGRMLGVPSNAFELIEFAAAREAVERNAIEARPPVRRPLDLLAQHVVSTALSGGVRPDDLLEEVRGTHAYRDLPDTEWQAVLDFVTHGGQALEAYPEFRKVRSDDGGLRVADRRIGLLHRMSIGTIASDGALRVKFLKGGTLGSVEESFLSRLKPGDAFLFAGRVLELVRIRDMTAYVRRARPSARAGASVWMGGRMPLSSELADAVRRQLTRFVAGEARGPELAAVAPILAVQREWSHIPRHDELLVERARTREGHHLFVYAFAGRLAHEGLGALAAYRLTRRERLTATVFATDYGLEVLTATPLRVDDASLRELLSPQALEEDLAACLNATEMARRQFREVARVAGLTFQGYPGRPKTARQLQASSGLFFDVFDRYEPDHLLLRQARREVLDRQLDLARLRATLDRLGHMDIVIRDPGRLTPFAFPIWSERVHSSVSSESWAERVQRMAADLERAADGR